MNPLGKSPAIIGAIAATAAALLGVVIMIVLVFQRNDTITMTEQWTAVEVTGGDTMVVRQTTGNQMQVRLCGINARESSVAATKKLRKLVAQAENQVLLIPVQKDSDGYVIAEILAYGQGAAEISFQEELLKAGLAKISQSGVECPNQLVLENAERMAKTAKVGVWGR